MIELSSVIVTFSGLWVKSVEGLLLVHMSYVLAVVVRTMKKTTDATIVRRTFVLCTVLCINLPAVFV